MTIQEVEKDHASLAHVDESDLVHLCFDNCSECDPDTVFYKINLFFQLCVQNVSFMKFTLIQVFTYLISNSQRVVLTEIQFE